MSLQSFRSLLFPEGPLGARAYWIRRGTTLLVVVLGVTVAVVSQRSPTRSDVAEPSPTSVAPAGSEDPPAATPAPDDQPPDSELAPTTAPDDATLVSVEVPPSVHDTLTSSSTTSTTSTTSTVPIESTTTVGGSTSPLGPATYDDLLAAYDCGFGAGDPATSFLLEELRGDDGSERVVEIVRDCPAEFDDELDEELGRPPSSWESVSRNRLANVTASPAQLAVLRLRSDSLWLSAELEKLRN